MKRILIAAAALMAVQASTARAADVIDEAMYDWTGLYAGLNAGYAFGGNDKVGVNPGFGQVGDLELSGVFGGAQLGYNWQIDQIVLGVEGDIQLSGISDDDDSGRFDMSNENAFFGTLRGRAGFAFDRALIYATGGLAFGSFDYEVENGAGVDLQDDFTATGYAVGAGVEYAFDESWSMKLEYLYANFGEHDINNGGVQTVATPDFHSVRLGVNWRF